LVIYPFGNILGQGLVDSDRHGALFSRDLMDQRAGFVRTGSAEVGKEWRAVRSFDIDNTAENRWATINRGNGVRGIILQVNTYQLTVIYTNPWQPHCNPV
jgi:hypothetical protein